MEPHKGNATNQHMQQKSLSAVTAQGPEDIMQHKFQNTYTQACEMKIARNQTKRSQRIIKNQRKGGQEYIKLSPSEITQQGKNKMK